MNRLRQLGSQPPGRALASCHLSPPRNNLMDLGSRRWGEADENYDAIAAWILPTVSMSKSGFQLLMDQMLPA